MFSDRLPKPAHVQSSPSTGFVFICAPWLAGMQATSSMVQCIYQQARENALAATSPPRVCHDLFASMN